MLSESRIRIGVLFITVLVSVAVQAERKFGVQAAGAQFDVSVEGDLLASDADVQTYIQHGAFAIAAYFGRFPMPRIHVRIRSVNGDRVRFGRSSPQQGGTIMLLIGQNTSAESLTSDWTLVHEMTHVAFPATKGDNHEWLGEGMATYVEPIARAQAGYLSEQEVWRQFVEYMPRGLPSRSDGGLDQAADIGRTYWGGALFCLIADIEIRKQTHGRKGLQDSLRAIMVDQGTMQWEWDINTILKTGDRATGTKVLETLYREWKDTPVTVDLNKLWKDLGIEKHGNSVVLTDKASQARIRQRLTERP